MDMLNESRVLRYVRYSGGRLTNVIVFRHHYAQGTGPIKFWFLRSDSGGSASEGETVVIFGWSFNVKPGIYLLKDPVVGVAVYGTNVAAERGGGERNCVCTADSVVVVVVVVVIVVRKAKTQLHGRFVPKSRRPPRRPRPRHQNTKGGNCRLPRLMADNLNNIRQLRCECHRSS